MNLIIDVHGLTHHFAGKQYYALGLLEGIAKQKKYEDISFHLVSTKKIKELNLPNAHWHIYSKYSFYVKLHSLTKHLPGSLLLSPTSFIPPILSHCPSVTVVYDTASLQPQSFKRNKKARFLESILFSRVMQKSSMILTISESVKRELITISPQHEKKISVIYPNLRTFPAPNLDYISPYNLQTDTYFLFVGTLEPRKNLINLIKGFKRLVTLSSEPQRPKLVLAGSIGWSADEIMESIKDEEMGDTVVLINNPSDFELASLYKHCLAFCYVSLYEGFGMPMLEAMSFNKAILHSNIPVLNEVAGDCGFIVDPTNSESIFNGLQELRSNMKLRQKLEARSSDQIKSLSNTAQIKTFVHSLKMLC